MKIVTAVSKVGKLNDYLGKSVVDRSYINGKVVGRVESVAETESSYELTFVVDDDLEVIFRDKSYYASGGTRFKTQ